MRILHVLPSINRLTGGPATAVPLQLRELGRLGHEVELFSTRWPDAAASSDVQVERRDGYVERVFPTSSLPGLGHVPYSRALVKAIRAESARFEVFHASSLWNPLIAHAMRSFRRLDLPYAITSHGTLDPAVFERNRIAKRAWAWAWERANVESAELIHFTSENELAKAMACGWRMRQVLVIPLDVDLQNGLSMPPRACLEKAIPSLAGKEVILFVGRINWVKNLDLLVSATGELVRRGRDVALVCVGPDGDGDRRGLERSAIKLGIAERVHFTGLLEGTSLREAYARADIVALVSRKENFGLGAADALAAGIPIVLSDGVDMGQDWSAPPVWRVRQEAGAVADGLASALDHSRAHPVPCRLARELAEREWGRSSAHRLADCYEEIVHRRRRHR